MGNSISRVIGGKWGKIALRSIGLVLLVLVLMNTDAGHTLQILAAADPLPLLLVLVLCFPLFALRSLRWLTLMSCQGIRLSPWLVFRVYLAGNYFGSFTPGRLGEFVKLMYVKRYAGVGMTTALTSVLADRLLDLWVLSVLGMLGIWRLDLLHGMSPAAMGLSMAALAAPLALMNRKLLDRLIRLAFKVVQMKRLAVQAERMEEDFAAGAAALVNPRLILGIIFTASAYLIYFFQCSLIADSLGVEMATVTLGLLMPISIFVTILPISPAGIGTREASLIFLFGLVNVKAETALGFSLVVFAVFFLFMGFVGYLFWLTLPARDETMRTQGSVAGDRAGGDAV